MGKRVLDVGNCVPDHAAIRRLLEATFGAEVLQAHGVEDTLAALESGGIDLVLVNRKLDRDYSDGMDIIKRVKHDPRLGSVPMMLVTNYAEHQVAAVAEGAEYGFGKLELAKPETHERLAKILSRAG
jgi:two-component system chemotaxis response regulator CheY